MRLNNLPRPALRDFSIQINWINNCRDTSPRPETVSIRDLADRFRVPATNRNKLPLAAYHALPTKKERHAQKDGPAFIPATFSKPDTRDQDDVVETTGFVLDFDGDVTRAEFEPKLKGFGYIAHTTYSHSEDAERWRILLPYDAPASPEEHRLVYQHFYRLFGGRLDDRSETLNQLWYSPACPPDAVHLYQCHANEAPLLSPCVIAKSEGDNRPKPKPKPKAKAVGSNIGTPAAIPDSSSDSVKSVIEALRYIIAEDRDIWIKVGMALKQEFSDEGLAIWLEWSQTSDKYDEDVARYQWDTFEDRTDGVTLGTIHHFAREGGWTGSFSGMAKNADIEELNADHFVSRENGKTCVFREKRDDERGRQWQERMGTKDIVDFYRNRRIDISTTAKPKLIGLGDFWLNHPNRRQYDDVVFAPNRETPGSYNLWRGFSVEPKQGDWSKMQHLTKEVICAGDDESYQYVLGWMASAIQHPDRPGEVAIVMQGIRGAGKGTFTHLLGRLFGQHYLQVTQARHLVGNFNAHLRDCILLFVDEALWAGDRQGENVLKALVTEPMVQIEPKGINSFSVPNYLHIMVSSNEDWVIPAGARERRYCVLQVSDIHAQDKPYFAAIRAEMDNGGFAAMLYDLQNMDLSKFNVREVPYTAGLKEQMLHSLSPERRWWFEELQSGQIWTTSKRATVDSTQQPPNSIARDVLQQRFAEACRGLHVSRGSETELGMLLTKVLPVGWPRDHRPAASGNTRAGRYYVFPDLDTARKHFEQVTGLIGVFEGASEGEGASNLTNLSNLSTKLRKVK
jgi:hypothetical protein